MKINNLFKYLIRFLVLQFIVSYFTIWYFDKFIFINSDQKFEIYLSLVEDRNRFVNFIPLSWIKIDLLFVLAITIFLFLIYGSKFYTYVNELDFTYQTRYIDDYFILYLSWNSYLFSLLYVFRIYNLYRSSLILFTFLVPFILLVFRNAELISSFLGRSSVNENFISFNLEKTSTFRNLRIVKLRNEVGRIKCKENDLENKILENVEKINKKININLVVVRFNSKQKLSKKLENYLIKLNKKVLIISESPVNFSKKFISRNIQINDNYIYYFNNDIQYGAKFILKRLFDISASILIIFVTLPLMLIVGLFILKISSFPILIKQNRVGLHGKKFQMYKFRTMEINSHSQRIDLEKLNKKSGPLFKIENDPRLLKGAKIIRQFSLDELPQLFNVLKGDMSLVGPRPLFEEDTLSFDSNYLRRLNVLPGMTGLLQINERNTDDFNVWYKYDMDYIDNWSLYLDLKILFKTLKILNKKKSTGI